MLAKETRKLNKLVKDPRLDSAAMRLEALVGRNPDVVAPAEIDTVDGRHQPALLAIQPQFVVVVRFDTLEVIGLSKGDIDDVSANMRRLEAVIKWTRLLGKSTRERAYALPASSPWSLFSKELAMAGPQRLARA